MIRYRFKITNLAVSCQKTGTLQVEKKAEMKVSRKWVNNEITYFAKKTTATAYVFTKRIFYHKETVGHKVVIKLLAEAEKEKLENLRLNTLAHKN
jgi:hypothetical protein